jgi:ribosome-associated protein
MTTPIADDMIRLASSEARGIGDTGADAKSLIAAGEVIVNGEVELRRARQLHRGVSSRCSANGYAWPDLPT